MPIDQASLSASTRIKYWRRLFSAYMTPSSSQLTFWHDRPTIEPAISSTPNELGPYYMRFTQKANYESLFDLHGVPMLDYRGVIGPQYNPIAIAQYALGNHTLWLESKDSQHLSKCISACDWLVENLEPNKQGVLVWHHNFDFEYVETLRSPWYSGLAQGQGVSALLRCYEATNERKYLDGATVAFSSLTVELNDGGVLHEDGNDLWIEEYMVTTPTHILNGFIWAMWGVRDYEISTGDSLAKEIWERCVATLQNNLANFDIGYWSLYDQSAGNSRLKMITSGFYHRLHIVQLRIMWQLTNNEVFRQYSENWHAYTGSRAKRTRAKIVKAIFKLLRY
jgi:heparosan-N-sulfate-glucuronate 5-epimerase